MKNDIIGAGIGGLSTAIALEQKGIEAKLFEQAERLEPVGAGILLANNAMQVYEKLGLRKKIEAGGNPVSSLNITDAQLRPISKLDLSYFERKFGVRSIAIHRGVLQELLTDELRSTQIALDHELRKVIRTQDGYSLDFANGEEVRSTVLIGADGIKSTVRRDLFPKARYRQAHQLCWRGIADYKLPSFYRNEVIEAWGRSGRFGFVQLNDDEVYWFALKSFKNDASEFSINEIEAYFEKYHPIVLDIIRATKKNRINTAEIIDLKPSKLWHTGSVCLMGDAAHATTPNMGQGACQAIEDAYVLSDCLSKYEPQVAFDAFQRRRLPKAHRVVKASWAFGKIAHLSNPVLIGVRDQLMRFTPASFNRRHSEYLFELGAE